MQRFANSTRTAEKGRKNGVKEYAKGISLGVSLLTLRGYENKAGIINLRTLAINSIQTVKQFTPTPCSTISLLSSTTVRVLARAHTHTPTFAHTQPRGPARRFEREGAPAEGDSAISLLICHCSHCQRFCVGHRELNGMQSGLIASRP